MVDFLSQDGAGHRCRAVPHPLRIDDPMHAYILLFIFSFTVRKWLFLVVTEQMLPGWWREMKGIVGGTKFTKLALTINNIIGKFFGLLFLHNYSSYR